MTTELALATPSQPEPGREHTADRSSCLHTPEPPDHYGRFVIRAVR
ncbi:hypothetical protein FHR83_003493 [Actinoplanes campanulatus]|uniref:Uncharacterized protein n=1 Tax=Actinoplanes campanulatus TaxID=113559 RepID=A0A7W5AGK0_9ACTN|nr:hypothetical protein [Actinoplanes campanulatus]MBB3095823.1 hypothetical protein [Actinoplanes campanulatus]